MGSRVIPSKKQRVPVTSGPTKCIGGSGWGHARCTPPPMGPNSFVFAYIFTKKCLHRRSMAPLTGAHPPTGNPGSATEMDLSSTKCFKKTYPALTIDSVQYSKKIQSIKILYPLCRNNFQNILIQVVSQIKRNLRW